MNEHVSTNTYLYEKQRYEVTKLKFGKSTSIKLPIL